MNSYDDEEESHAPTRELLLNILDELEVLIREFIFTLISPSGNLSAAPKLIPLIFKKQEELLTTLNLALKQIEIENKIEEVQNMIEMKNREVRAMALKLVEAEQVVSAAIYQAKIKLDNIRKARSIPVDDIIRFSHKISASYSICAPDNWTQGDTRRPYPTDLWMRSGALGRSENVANADATPIAAPVAGTVTANTQLPTSTIHTAIKSDFVLTDIFSNVSKLDEVDSRSDSSSGSEFEF